MSEVGRGEEEREGERQTNELERRTRKDDFCYLECFPVRAFFYIPVMFLFVDTLFCL